MYPRFTICMSSFYCVRTYCSWYAVCVFCGEGGACVWRGRCMCVERGADVCVSGIGVGRWDAC